ncbi:zinc ribbon domain-containing protein [Parolsenella sp. LCP21S3_E11]|uniref:zinc ribbon domain-containing protein n=1 Tax=Parolsenella sp. LCP21S3_E11 TaxID=3438797 RepID=UPI003F9DD58E
MFCTNCGAQVPDGSKFCTHCGSPIAAAPAPAPAPVPPAPAPEPVVPPVPTPVDEAPQAAPEPAPMPEPVATPAPEPAAVPVPTPVNEVPQAAPIPTPVPTAAPVPPAPAPTAAPVPPAPVPPAPVPPAPQANYDSPVPPAPQVNYAAPTPGAGAVPPAKKSKTPLIIGIAAVVLVAVIALVVVPMFGKGGSWSELDLSGNGYNHEFCIEMDEDENTITVIDQDEKVTGTIDSTETDGDNVIYTLKDISWGDWGTSLFSSCEQKTCKVVAPKGATASKPWGKWMMIVTAYDASDPTYPYYVRSSMFEIDEDGTGTYEFAYFWGTTSSEANTANPLSSNYDVDDADGGFSHSLTWEGSKGDFDIESDNGTDFTLSVE